MSKVRSTNRKKALKIWLDSGRSIKLKDIALKLGVSDSSIRKWKSLDKWDEVPEKRKRGGQTGNRNAKGNKGGAGGPPGNDKAVTHGLFRKFEPQDAEYLEILEIAQQMDPVDMIWHNITKGFQKIIWAQRIFFIKDKEDMTKELKKEKPGEFGDELEWEIQFAWDKYASFIKAEAIVMREIRGAIKQFLSIAPESDERRLKLDQMQAQVEKTRMEIEELKNGEKDRPTEINVKRWSHVPDARS
ncbi:phage terminase small subunit [Paenibacillus kribbensis]|uniref:phage terminase small subunit n=1 Tax=Paenibacillus kribbensis TaxID=172713 RepID=UPI002DB563E6|nr:phage terminase small subunit [Paenibacillus kribbensis]MEC0233721.1 phage terminase small subunit [Paenibacillus kribbensis]